MIGGNIDNPPAFAEYADLMEDYGDHPCRTTVIGGQLVVMPLTDPDDLADYYEAMHEGRP